MDFAGELQREVRDSKQYTNQKKKKKKRKDEDASDEGEGSEGSKDESEFDYDGMDEQAWGDSEAEEGGEEGGRGGTMSEAELEKVLLDNMSDDDCTTERDGGRARGAKKNDKSRANLSLRGRFDASKMFAAADEFSHLLEDRDIPNRGSNVKQLAWEEKQSVQRNRKMERRGRGRGRGRGGGGTGERGVSKGRERGGGKNSGRGRRGRSGGGGGGVKRERVERGSGSNWGAFSASGRRGRTMGRGRWMRKGTNTRT